MHDLNTISKLNAEAHAHSIKTAQAAGKWVLAKFTGLTLFSTSEHASAKEAEQAKADGLEGASPDVHYTIFEPTA